MIKIQFISPRPIVLVISKSDLHSGNTAVNGCLPEMKL